MNKHISVFLLSLLMGSLFSVTAAETKQQDSMPQALQDILLNDKAPEEDATYFSDIEINENYAVQEKKTPFTVYNTKLTFEKLGWNQGLTMFVGQKETGISFTLPTDKIITNAKLELIISMIPEMAEKTPHLGVKINGQDLGVLLLSSIDETDYELSVPAEYLSQENTISFELTDEEPKDCKVESDNKKGIFIGKDSFLAVSGNMLAVESDLTVFPLPFFDKYDYDQKTVHYVISKNYGKDIIRAASMLSAYFGTKAEHAGVNFKVHIDTIPQEHSIIFGHPKEIVAGMELPEEPGIYIKNNIYYRPYKNIFIVAKNEEDFVRAIYQLIEPQYDGITDLIDVSYFPIQPRSIPRSAPYDAKNWIPTDRKVYLTELLKKDQTLLTSGFWHSATILNFRVSPDIFQLYDRQGDLYISYEFPSLKELDEVNSGLNVKISENYFKLPVNKKGLLENIWRLSGGNVRETNKHILIDPSMIWGENELNLYFDLRLKPKASCSVLNDKNIKSVIDDTSYIDLSDSVHFSKLPNLSYFAGASFPFTKYADYSETAILLPPKPSESELNTLFSMMARSGKSTGNVVTNESIFIGNYEYLRNRDLLMGKHLFVVATLSNQNFLNQLFEDSAFEFNGDELNIYDYGIFDVRGGLLNGLKRFLSGDFRRENSDANRYIRTSSSWRGFLSMVSPFDEDRIVVLTTATDDMELERIGFDLENNKISSSVGGDITIISGSGKIANFSVGDSIYIGDVSNLFKIMYFAGEHILWLAFVSFFIIVLLSIIVSVKLQRRAVRRLNPDIFPTDRIQR